MASDFLEKIGSVAKNVTEKAGDAFKSVTVKAGDALEINRINSKINGERQKISSLKQQLGESIWSRFETGESFDDDITAFCNQIVERQQSIQALESEIQRIRDAQAAAAQKPAADACPSCGSKLEGTLKFCPTCGASLAAEPVPEDNLSDPSKKTCSNCGKELSPEQRFCGACGAKAEE